MHMRKIDYHLVVVVRRPYSISFTRVDKRSCLFSSVQCVTTIIIDFFHYLRVILLLLVMVMPYIGRKRERELDHLIVDSASVFGGL